MLPTGPKIATRISPNKPGSAKSLMVQGMASLATRCLRAVTLCVFLRCLFVQLGRGGRHAQPDRAHDPTGKKQTRETSAFNKQSGCHNNETHLLFSGASRCSIFVKDSLQKGQVFSTSLHCLMQSKLQRTTRKTRNAKRQTRNKHNTTNTSRIATHQNTWLHPLIEAATFKSCAPKHKTRQIRIRELEFPRDFRGDKQPSYAQAYGALLLLGGHRITRLSTLQSAKARK